MKWMSINRIEFEAIPSVRRIIASTQDDHFWSIDLDEPAGVFGVGWPGDSIEPVVKLDREGRFWCGVNFGLSVIDTKSGTILVLFTMSSRVLSIELFPDLALIVGESEILILNASLTVRQIVNVGDVICSVKRIGEHLEIRMLDSNQLNVKI
jgi:hypothetical protein